MIEKIFKCIVCEGNVYPCVLSIKTEAKTLVEPTKCPFDGGNPNWEEVSK